MDPMSLTDVSLHTAAGPERKCSQAKAANSTSSCSHSVKNSSASSRCRNQAVKWSVARPNMVGVVGFACAAVFCGVALSGEIKGAAALYVRPGAQAPQLTGHAGSFGSTEYPLSQRVDVEGDGIHPREPSSPEPRSQFYIHPVKRQATGVEPADAEGSFSQLREQGFDLDLDLDLDFDLDDLPQTTAGGADSAMGEEPTDKAKKEKSPNADLDFGSSETSGSTGSLGGDFDFGSSEKNDSTTKSSNYETERDLFGQGTAAPVTGVLSPLSGKSKRSKDDLDWARQNTSLASEKAVLALEKQRAEQRAADEAARNSRLGAPPVNLYTRAVDTVPATNYLGVGYDSIKGNPIGDPKTMMDPGLRSPILKFTFVQGMDGVTNDLEYLQPIGAFTRPFAACRQSETVSELDSLTDYQKELGSDASLNSGDMLGLNSFSGSAGYQQFAQQTNRKQTKTFMLKTYCLRYEAGIAQNASFKWNYTLAFENAVDDLPVTFDGEGPDSACTVEQWRQDHSVEACEKTNIPVWMGFIEQFGTHYTVRLLAGGKMTYQVQFRSEDVRDLRKRGVDIKAEVKLMLGGVSGGSNSGTKSSKSQESHIQSVNYEKETIVIGGKPPGDVSDPAALATWAESVEALPMPVKLELLPLENLLPEAKRAAFTQAVSYYSKAYGMSLMDLQSLSGTAQPIQKVLVNATQVIWAGPPPGFAKCPGDEVVLFGFAIHMNFKVETSGLAQYHIVACTAGREKCDGVGSQNDWMDDERIFMLCSKEPSNDFLQVVGETEAGEQTVEATCPGDTVIAVGFGISLATGFDSAEKVQMEPCQAGQTSCTKNLSEGSVKAFVWMVCTEKTFPGVQKLHNVVNVAHRGKANKWHKGKDGSVTLSCPEGERNILGFAMEAHTHLPNVRDGYTLCREYHEKCTLTGRGVDKTLLGSDRHSLLGWMVCSGPQDKPAENVE